MPFSSRPLDHELSNRSNITQNHITQKRIKYIETRYPSRKLYDRVLLEYNNAKLNFNFYMVFLEDYFKSFVENM